MKTYSALIITDKDKIDILYECDKKNNKQCKKERGCRECNYTTELRYAKDISNEKTRLELKQEIYKKNNEIEEYKQTIRRILKGENIYNFKTLNEIREIYNLKPIE